MSLRNPKNKMSKSDSNASSRILMNDSDDQIASKIRKATTDTQLGISWDPVERPGVTNLINILACIMNEEPIAVAEKYSNDSNQQFKNRVTDAVVSIVRPVREKMDRINRDMDLELILEDGESRARDIAENTMKEVRNVIGLSD